MAEEKQRITRYLLVAAVLLLFVVAAFWICTIWKHPLAAHVKKTRRALEERSRHRHRGALRALLHGSAHLSLLHRRNGQEPGHLYRVGHRRRNPGRRHLLSAVSRSRHVPCDPLTDGSRGEMVLFRARKHSPSPTSCRLSLSLLPEFKRARPGRQRCHPFFEGCQPNGEVGGWPSTREPCCRPPEPPPARKRRRGSGPAPRLR